MTESEEEVIEGLRNIVKTQIGSFAVPEILLVSPCCDGIVYYYCNSKDAILLLKEIVPQWMDTTKLMVKLTARGNI